MQVIREICDQVVVIDQGQIVESGQVWSVFSNPQQKITQELLNLEQLDLPFQLHAEPTTESSHVILRLSYASTLQHAPDLNSIFSVIDRPVHLYQSHIDSIQEHLIGKFVVAVPHKGLDLNQLQQQLQAQFAAIEVLGYARPTH